MSGEMGCFAPPAYLTREDVIELLKESLRIDVESSSVYIGDNHGGPSLYKSVHIVKLVLDDEVLSEFSLD